MTIDKDLDWKIKDLEKHLVNRINLFRMHGNHEMIAFAEAVWQYLKLTRGSKDEND